MGEQSAVARSQYLQQKVKAHLFKGHWCALTGGKRGWLALHGRVLDLLMF